MMMMNDGEAGWCKRLLEPTQALFSHFFFFFHISLKPRVVHTLADDAKKGFSPGGASLHPCITAHGPDAATVASSTDAILSVLIPPNI